MRASPFPERNGRSPGGLISPPTSAPTRPLQLNPRSTTPTNSSSPGPSRPQRSELRNRTSEYSDRTSSTYNNRDSISTTVSDASNYGYGRNIRNGATSNPATPSNSARPRPQRLRSVPTDDEGPTSATSQISTPTSLASAMSAFQSAGSRRRAMTNGSNDFEYQKEREQEMEAERARQQRIRDKVPGRRVNGRVRAGDIDAVLDQIKDQWEFVIDPEFNTVDLALQLLDESSLGKDIESFKQTKELLAKALKGSVDKHYQAFQASIPHHASLLNHFSAVQTQIDDARSALQEAKDSLGTRRTDLMQLWARGQTLEEMMRILDQIEHLKTVPDLLETLMSEKRLLQASILLIQSLKLINKPEMTEISALSDLRSYLVSQESALRDILIDELHGHLYLKSFWCESRWTNYVPNQQTFSKVAFEDESDSKEPILPPPSPSTPLFRQTRLTRFLHDLAIRPNDPPHNLNDTSSRNNPRLSAMSSLPSSRNEPSNPEADSFAYMETVLESLAILGRLGNALDSVVQRVPTELYSLVEITIEEVSERAEFGRQSVMYSVQSTPRRSQGVYTFSTSDSHSTFNPSVVPNAELSAGSKLRLSALESSMKHVDHEILKDFFWTLYSKMDALAQGLRVIYEVANRIGSRRDFKDSSGTKPGALFPLDDVWLSVQAEIRTLIYDYLTSEEQGMISRRNPITSIHEILREGKFTRDKAKSVFRFADTDTKLTAKILRTHEDELTKVLKDTMPGLVQGSAENAAQATLSTVGMDDRLGAGQHHRLLIKPDAFHASVLFQPTLAFLDRVVDVLPSGLDSARASGAVLDEFVLKVYLPQLEEKVSTLFLNAVTGPDAFLADPQSRRLSPQHIVKSSTQLIALINSLRVMLQVTPFHRENYSRLILGVIIQYYQRCSDRLQDLVTAPILRDGEEPKIALGAQWAQRSELTPCISELLSHPDLVHERQLCRQETNLEIGFLGQNVIAKGDLIPSTRNIAALASLYHSVSWFAAELTALKPRPEDIPATPLTQNSLEPLSAVSATPFLPPIIVSPEDNLSLPLSKEMALRYQALIKTYEQLADLILVTIRIDLRCRSMYYLDCSMRHGNYNTEREASEPDGHVVDLNAELTEVERSLSTNVSSVARRFIFVGLGSLIDQLLITDARLLRLPTAFGIKKINRNMLALQQCIRSITDDQESSEFRRAKQYYLLFSVSPQEMLDGIRKKQLFSFDEYQTMLNLQCRVDQTQNGEERTSRATDRNYSMYVIDLHGLEMESQS